MFCFFLIFLTASHVIFANPVPNDSTDVNNLTFDTASVNPNGDDNSGNDPASLDPSSIANSVITTPNNPGCTSDTSVKNPYDDNNQKRSETPGFCRADPGYHVHIGGEGQRATIDNMQNFLNDPKNRCRDPRFPAHLWCGGPEVLPPKQTSFPPLDAVLNCFEGKFYLWHF